MDTIFGNTDGFYARAEGVKTVLTGVELEPATMFDVYSGQSDDSAPAGRAVYDINTQIRAGTIVSNVATL